MKSELTKKIEKFYKKLSVKKKIGYGFGTCITLTLVLMIMAIGSVGLVGNQLNKLYNGPFQVCIDTKNIIINLTEIQSDLRAAALYENYEDYDDSINESSNKILTILKEMTPIYNGDKQSLSDFEKEFNIAVASKEEIFNTMKNGDYKAASVLIRDEYLPEFKKIEDLAVDMEHGAEERAAAFKSNAQKYIIIIVVLLICVVALAVFIASFIGNIITSLITDPMDKLKVISSELCEGNLDIEIENEVLTLEDEFGEFAVMFNQMISTFKLYISDISDTLKQMSDKDFTVKSTIEYKGNFVEIQHSINSILDALNETLSEINEAAKQVNGGSMQVSKSSQVLSEGSEEQAQSIQELTSVIKSINNKISESAKNANNTREITNTLYEEIDSSNTKMQEMLAAIEDIEASSNNISTILTVIEDIAEQTSLLSLNASIESVKAGEMGKSFAVVAEEIKKLASESVNAVKDSAQLISQSIESVNIGKHLAKETAESLKLVVSEINTTSSMVEDIAKASREQATSIEEINEGIVQISDVVQSNSAISEQSAASSEELTAQAQTLQNMINEFKLA